MVDAVLDGDGLDAVATVAAEAAGGAVAVVLPAVGAAIAGAGGERRLDAVRRCSTTVVCPRPAPRQCCGSRPWRPSPSRRLDRRRGARGRRGRPGRATATTSTCCSPASATAPRSARGPSPGASRRAAVGFSAHEPSPGRLHEALREADVALALVLAGEATPADAAAGAWQLLVRLAVSDSTALRRLRDTSVGPALADDADHGSDLLGTFRTYLAHGAHMNAAAAAIPSHRHTVAYRLERLSELTGLDPARADDRERLGLGLKATAVLDAIAGDVSRRASARS